MSPTPHLCDPVTHKQGQGSTHKYASDVASNGQRSFSLCYSVSHATSVSSFKSSLKMFSFQKLFSIPLPREMHAFMWHCACVCFHVALCMFSCGIVHVYVFMWHCACVCFHVALCMFLCGIVHVYVFMWHCACFHVALCLCMFSCGIVHVYVFMWHCACVCFHVALCVCMFSCVLLRCPLLPQSLFVICSSWL